MLQTGDRHSRSAWPTTAYERAMVTGATSALTCEAALARISDVHRALLAADEPQAAAINDALALSDPDALDAALSVVAPVLPPGVAVWPSDWSVVVRELVVHIGCVAMVAE